MMKRVPWVECACEWCGVVFEARPSEVRRGGGRYCCPAHGYTALRKQHRPCGTCGVVAYLFPSGECRLCAQYRKKRGVPRPYGAQDGRALGTAAAARKRVGPAGHSWKRDRSALTRGGAYSYARAVLPTLGACEHCGELARYRHHWDKNPWNNALGNLAQLCKDCHETLHRYGYGTPLPPQPRPPDAVNRAWRRARVLVPALGRCELCEGRPAYDRHHWDRDPLNNRRENLIRVCRSCHWTVHAHGYV